MPAYISNGSLTTIIDEFITSDTQHKVHYICSDVATVTTLSFKNVSSLFINSTEKLQSFKIIFGICYQ